MKRYQHLGMHIKAGCKQAVAQRKLPGKPMGTSGRMPAPTGYHYRIMENPNAEEIIWPNCCAQCKVTFPRWQNAVTRPLTTDDLDDQIISTDSALQHAVQVSVYTCHVWHGLPHSRQGKLVHSTPASSLQSHCRCCCSHTHAAWTPTSYVKAVGITQERWPGIGRHWPWPAGRGCSWPGHHSRHPCPAGDVQEDSDTVQQQQ